MSYISGKDRGRITYLSCVKPLAAEVSFSPASSWMPTIWARARKRVADMTKVAIVFAILLAASPVAAQSQQQELGTGGMINNSILPNTGIFCIEEMTATFCNVPSGPNTNGYGSSGGSAAGGGSVSIGVSAASSGVRSNASSLPLCASGTPANELCD